TGGGGHSVPGQSVRVWNDVEGKVKWRPLRDSPDAVYRLAVSPDGRSVVAPIPERVLGVWDLEKGELRAKWEHRSEWVSQLVHSCDGRVIIVVGGVKGFLGPWGQAY